MKLIEVNTWPNSLRWISFLPISIIAFLLFWLLSYLSELRYPGSKFFFLLFLQLIGRPITAYVGMYIVPKAKKIIGYIYVAFFTLDLFSEIVFIINSHGDFETKLIGNLIGIFLGTIVTVILIINKMYDQSDYN